MVFFPFGGKYLEPSRHRKFDQIQCLAEELVPKNDQEVFVKMVLDALQRLHEGSVARYRLKLSEFLSWQPIRDPQ